jgi:hypothetical protein
MDGLLRKAFQRLRIAHVDARKGILEILAAGFFPDWVRPRASPSSGDVEGCLRAAPSKSRMGFSITSAMLFPCFVSVLIMVWPPSPVNTVYIHNATRGLFVMRRNGEFSDAEPAPRQRTGGGCPPRGSGSAAAVGASSGRGSTRADDGGQPRHWSSADALSADSRRAPKCARTLRMRARYEVANNSYAKGIG